MGFGSPIQKKQHLLVNNHNNVSQENGLIYELKALSNVVKKCTRRRHKIKAKTITKSVGKSLKNKVIFLAVMKKQPVSFVLTLLNLANEMKVIAKQLRN